MATYNSAINFRPTCIPFDASDFMQTLTDKMKDGNDSGFEVVKESDA